MTRRDELAAALEAAATGPWTPLELADAALAALEEPTEAMVWDAWDVGGFPHDDGIDAAEVQIKNVWRAMIAAAKEG